MQVSDGLAYLSCSSRFSSIIFPLASSAPSAGDVHVRGGRAQIPIAHTYTHTKSQNHICTHWNNRLVLVHQWQPPTPTRENKPVVRYAGSILWVKISTFSTSDILLWLLLGFPFTEILWLCTWRLCSSFSFCSQTCMVGFSGRLQTDYISSLKRGCIGQSVNLTHSNKEKGATNQKVPSYCQWSLQSNLGLHLAAPLHSLSSAINVPVLTVHAAWGWWEKRGGARGHIAWDGVHNS